MPVHPLAEKVMVSQKSFDSDESYDIVCSNVTVVNALFEEHFTAAEIAPRALRSYYVDYYLAQVNNGGFSQFVYNTNWHDFVVRQVQAGLREMNAARHADLFEQGADLISKAGVDALDEYL